MAKRTSYSFEFFPPKDTQGEERLWAAMTGLEALHPDFISVTYGAGGSTRDRTIAITSHITERTKIPTVAHLTCVGSTKTELIEILGKYREAGITSILALRGDPVGGPSAPWSTTPGGFDHADQLVELAKDLGGFSIGVAAFPDGHPASGGNFEKDIDVLIKKESLGATFATTQFFFEVDRWRKLVDRMSELGGTPIPDSIMKRFLEVEDDSEAVRALGVEIATDLCQKLLAEGVPGIHFYTMNSSTATREIYENLGVSR